MAIDASLVDAATAAFLQTFTGASGQAVVHAQAVANQAVSDVQYLAFRARKDNEVISNLVLNRIISDQTGTDGVSEERTLTAREVQFQPQEATYADPNYRPGASPPTAPPVAAAGK